MYKSVFNEIKYHPVYILLQICIKFSTTLYKAL